MDAKTWEAMPPLEKLRHLDTTGLSPQLVGKEGWRVQVTPLGGGKPRRFIVGKSTGWKPVHLELAYRTSRDGPAADFGYAEVIPLYQVFL